MCLACPQKLLAGYSSISVQRNSNCKSKTFFILRGVPCISNGDFRSTFCSSDARLWEARLFQEFLHGGHLLSRLQERGIFRLVRTQSALWIKSRASGSRNVHRADLCGGFHDAVPGHYRNRVRKCRQPARRFSAIRMGIELRNCVSVQGGPRTDIDQHQHPGGERAAASARRRVFCPDFRADKCKQFRQQNPGKQQRQNPRVEARQPVPRKSNPSPRPQQRNSSRSANVQQKMQYSRERCRQKKCRDPFVFCSGGLLRRAPFALQQTHCTKRNCDHPNCSQNRMSKGGSRGQICARPSERRQQIQIRNRPRERNAHDKPPRPAGKNSPHQCERCERVRGRIHGQDFKGEIIVLATFPRGTSNFRAFGTIENSTGRRASGSPSTCA